MQDDEMNLERLKELSEKATAGPWQVEGCRGKIISGKTRFVFHNVGSDSQKVAGVWFDEKSGEGFADAHFIVAAANYVRDMLSRPLGGVEKLAETICRDVAELPDRTSPDDWPEAMLVTGEELALIIRTTLTDHQPCPRMARPLSGRLIYKELIA